MIDIDKIFQALSNIIWDDGTNYILEHIPTKTTCRFDRTSVALEAVQKAIKRDRSFAPTATKAFCIQPKSRKKYYLSQLLYGVYHDRSLSWVREGRVNFRDGDTCNLTSQNLSHTHVDEADNINRRIWRSGNYIFLYHKKSGKCFFCDYDPELFKLLCAYRILWGYLPDLGRLQATVLRKKRKMNGFPFGFHTLVYAFHHYGARRNNFIGAIRRLKKDLQRRGLAIDHLDDSQENNCVWNLSLMTRAQNSEKHNRLGRVRDPFFFLAVYRDGTYKVACGRIFGLVADIQFDMALVLCESPDELIALIRQFLVTEWPDGLSPSGWIKEQPEAICYQDYFGDFGASGIREILLEKDKNDFTLWKDFKAVE